MYKNIIYPLLKKVDAETVHDRTIRFLEILQERAIGRLFLRTLAGSVPENPVSLMGMDFPNRLGIAAGFDKDVRIVHALASLGFGHVEVGTVTPKPQAGNPRPRLFRLAKDRAIINRMGFPNCGATVAAERLRLLKNTNCQCRVGVSLGKQKSTPIENAALDYVDVMTSVYPYADYLAINVSSPNTRDLRLLQAKVYLDELLGRVADQNEVLAEQHCLDQKPILIKIAPDLTFHEIDVILESALHHGISGVVATNTTVARDDLSSRNKKEVGGLSGLPVAKRCNEIIAHLSQRIQDQMVIIGVGGVFGVEDARKKVAAGASLVQVYTGLVYEGPGLAGRIIRAM